MNGFVTYLQGPKRKSPNTWRTYTVYTSEFIEFLDGQSCHWFDADQDLIDYYYSLKINGCAGLPKVDENSWNVIQTAITHLYKFALKKKLITNLPFSTRASYSRFHQGEEIADELRTRGTPKPVNYISLEQYKEHWRPLINRQEQAQRNSALIEMLICTGFRISEVLNQDIYSLPDPDNSRWAGMKVIPVRVLGKGNKVRVVPVPKRILRAVHFYMEEDRRDALLRGKVKGNKRSEKVFLSENGEKLSVRQVEEIFMQLSKATGIKLTPHGCRHMYATFMRSLLQEVVCENDRNIRNGEPDRFAKLLGDPDQILQKLLGHANVETVFIYTEICPEVYGMLDTASSRLDAAVV
ncbi:tyrosine-type recombinase/integrase [Herbaspirillum sp. C9C3]|uniref:tyrosine-type recombinase/integrase n=1 Tax=Herbaspirillum sp. C9C3 TaxID=2735271 RepID=UPI0015858A1F|nr:tyrosine-type recombinase/integrase [Herbaspirillum sp. C9C3]NUT60764.1 tyrosine-type recombinase/integrase [Herbaspirillum sp. C9C3]